MNIAQSLMTDIARLNSNDIDRLLATTDLSATDVFCALRDHFYARPNKTRAAKWEGFFKLNSTLFAMVTDEDIDMIRDARGF